MRTASNHADNANAGQHPSDAKGSLPFAAQLQEPCEEGAAVHRVRPEKLAGHALGMELNTKDGQTFMLHRILRIFLYSISLLLIPM